MLRICSWFLAAMLSCFDMAAQTALPTVQANGSATLTAQPDQAQLDVGVVTSGATAQEAAQLNASVSNTMQTALRKAMGAVGTLQTVSYYVTPRYSSGPNQTIIGYTASNTVRITTPNLSLIGQLIDTANQNGANTVGGLSFGLIDPEPLTQQALTQATKKAAGHAAAIASGFGRGLGAVLSAQENSTYAPVTVAGVSAGAGTTTPVNTGTVTVTATVTIQMALQ